MILEFCEGRCGGTIVPFFIAISTDCGTLIISDELGGLLWSCVTMRLWGYRTVTYCGV